MIIHFNFVIEREFCDRYFNFARIDLWNLKSLSLLVYLDFVISLSDKISIILVKLEEYGVRVNQLALRIEYL